MAGNVQYIRYQNMNENVTRAFHKTPPIGEQGAELALKYAQMTQSINEVHQLYCQYLWNRKQLHHVAPCSVDDYIKETACLTSNADMLVAVNSVATNYISAARNEIDRADVVLRDLVGDQSSDYIVYRKLISNFYDKTIYKLMYELRNYMQHGQQVVTVARDSSGLRVWFDLNQLANPLHFKAKSKVVEMLREYTQGIEARNETAEPHFSFRVNLDYFHECVVRQYLSCLKGCRSCVSSLCKEMDALIQANQGCLIQDCGHCYLYFYKDDCIHVVDGLDAPYCNTLTKFIESAKHDYDTAKKIVCHEKRAARHGTDINYLLNN